MNARIALAVLGAALVTCTAPSTNKAPLRPTYQYSLAAPADDLHPGDVRSLTWKTTRSGENNVAFTSRLCFAVIGAFASVGDLKSSAQVAPRCPINAPGVVYASDVAEVDPYAEVTVTQDLRLPKSLAPGLYSFVQVVDWGGGNAISAGGIITVVSAP